MKSKLYHDEPSMRIILTFAHIAGIGDVKNDKVALKINLELAQKIMKLIDDAEQETNAEIVFAADFRKIINDLKKQGFGTLSIDNQFVIHSDYYNKSFNLPPLAKAILVLHIRHPEGIYRKQVAENEIKAELKKIYAILAPTKSPKQVENTIENLCDFSKKNYDRQTCIINQVIRQNLDKIAEHYLIKGDKRNDIRRLDFENVAFCLPENLKNLK